MMMFPTDRAIYLNLNTAFTDYAELLNDLATRRANGYVRVSFPSYEGIMFLVAGKVVNGVQQEESGKTTGIPALRSIAAKAREKGGTINAFELSPDFVTLYTSLIDGEVVYRDLSSDFTSLDKLIVKLQAAAHTGSIDVLFSDGRGTGTVFLKAGEMVEATYSVEGEFLSGRTAAEQVVRVAAEVGATFNVLKTHASGTWEPKDQPAAAAAAAKPATLANADEVLRTWGEILSAVEEEIDSISKKGRFLLAFNEACIERADTYPFLDPFAAEFEYKEGRAIFHGAPPPELNTAMNECLEDAIARLTFQLRREDLENRIRERLSGITRLRSVAAGRNNFLATA